MEKTIMTGDRVLGTRFAYWFSAPKRGDIVVFRYPVDEAKGKKTKFIKRIIGLPGETVTISDGVVYIDGEPIEEDYIAELTRNKLDFIGPQTVPEGCVFVMGDNRNMSNDSRKREIGMVDSRLIVGKVYMIIFPVTSFGSVY